MPNHPIKIPQLSVKCLTDCLEGAGWSKGPADIVLGGQLLVDVLPEVTLPEAVTKAKSQAESRKADAAWCDAPVEFEVTEKQRDAVKRCLTFWTEKGAIPGGRYSSALLLAFGLGGE